MRKLYVFVSAIVLSATIRGANSPAWMDVPREIQILRLPWISKSMTQALCAENFPSLVAKYSSTLSAHQTEVRKAETMVRKDATEQGADGQRYLAAYMKETQQIIEQTYKEAAKIPRPTEAECQSLVSSSAKADDLFRMWRFFVRQMKEKEAGAARAQEGAR